MSRTLPCTPSTASRRTVEIHTSKYATSESSAGVIGDAIADGRLGYVAWPSTLSEKVWQDNGGRPREGPARYCAVCGELLNSRPRHRTCPAHQLPHGHQLRNLPLDTEL